MNGKEEFINNFKKKTKCLALNILELNKILPKNREGNVIGKQLIRSGTSVAANYRAMCRARSSKEFYSKISLTLEEADETLFWLELIEESKLIGKTSKFYDTKQLADEIVSVLTTARKKSSMNLKK
ncbi:MAG: four helix bundle protein [Flavobacteriales bacterium]